jgi:hypothetical protein
MKKAFIYFALAALTQLGMPSAAFSRTAHSSIPGSGLSAHTPSRAIRPIFPQHRHHKRFHQFDSGFAGPYPGWLYAPDLDQTGGALYGPGAEYGYPPEDLPPPVPTRCVPEDYSVSSERGDGQAKVTVTRCNVPILIPGSRPASPPTDLK